MIVYKVIYTINASQMGIQEQQHVQIQQLIVSFD